MNMSVFGFERKSTFKSCWSKRSI